jgi:hypothetical protein
MKIISGMSKSCRGVTRGGRGQAELFEVLILLGCFTLRAHLNSSVPQSGFISKIKLCFKSLATLKQTRIIKIWIF